MVGNLALDHPYVPDDTNPYLANMLRFIDMNVKLIKVTDTPETRELLGKFEKSTRKSIESTLRTGNRPEITESRRKLNDYLSDERGEALKEVAPTSYSRLSQQLKTVDFVLGSLRIR